MDDSGDGPFVNQPFLPPLSPILPAQAASRDEMGERPFAQLNLVQIHKYNSM
jgi:hypothetical protein